MVDLLVIGGGINGVGIARDAAGRGLSVALVGGWRSRQRHVIRLRFVMPQVPELRPRRHLDARAAERVARTIGT